MIALYSFFPAFCPNCGEKTGHIDAREYFGHICHVCPCGMHFVYVGKAAAAKMAKSVGSDLGRYL